MKLNKAFWVRVSFVRAVSNEGILQLKLLTLISPEKNGQRIL